MLKSENSSLSSVGVVPGFISNSPLFIWSIIFSNALRLTKVNSKAFSSPTIGTKKLYSFILAVSLFSSGFPIDESVFISAKSVPP